MRQLLFIVTALMVAGSTMAMRTVAFNPATEQDACTEISATDYAAPFSPGDVNNDGEINIADVNVVINAILSDTFNMNCDVNGDGEVNIADVNAIITIILGGSISTDMTITVNGVTFKMIHVEGGTFTMGATAEQGSDASSDESPTHQVTLSAFSIGETEVTQALWQAVMGSNPSYFSPTNGYDENLNRPVEMVTWNDCQSFINKLNQMTGKQFRLPTEAEWEFAARGGNKSHSYKYSGSNTIGDVAWYWDNIPSQTIRTPGYGTQPVGTKQANELGLYDMSGNVWEWIQDRYGSYSSTAQTNPTGPATGSYRVRRGGGWGYHPKDCRVSKRYYDVPSMGATSGLGLRLAL